MYCLIYPGEAVILSTDGIEGEQDEEVNEDGELGKMGTFM